MRDRIINKGMKNIRRRAENAKKNKRMSATEMLWAEHDKNLRCLDTAGFALFNPVSDPAYRDILCFNKQKTGWNFMGKEKMVTVGTNGEIIVHDLQIKEKLGIRRERPMPRSPFGAVTTAGRIKDILARYTRVIDWALQVGLLAFDFLQLGSFAFRDQEEWNQAGDASQVAGTLQDLGLETLYPSYFLQLAASAFTVLLFFFIIVKSDWVEMQQLKEVMQPFSSSLPTCAHYVLLQPKSWKWRVILETSNYYCKFISRPIFIINFRIFIEIFDCDFSTKIFEPAPGEITCFECTHIVVMLMSTLIIFLYWSMCIRFMFVGSDLSYMEVRVCILVRSGIVQMIAGLLQVAFTTSSNPFKWVWRAMISVVSDWTQDGRYVKREHPLSYTPLGHIYQV